MEIKVVEDKIEELRRSIESDNVTLSQLRQNAEALNEVEILKRQIRGELESVVELFGLFGRENVGLLQKYGFQSLVPHDITADELFHVARDFIDNVSKLDKSNQSDLTDAIEKVRKLEGRQSQVAALYNHNKQMLNERKDRRQVLVSDVGGVQKIKQTVQLIRSYDSQIEVPTISTDAEPQEIIAHVTRRISESSESFDTPESIIRTIKKLRYLGKKRNENGAIACPCCERAMDQQANDVFIARMESLANVELSDIIKNDRVQLEESRVAVRNYEQWRTTGLCLLYEILVIASIH